MPSAGFEPATPSTKRPQTYALERAATEVGYMRLISCKIRDPQFENRYHYSPAQNGVGTTRDLINMGYFWGLVNNVRHLFLEGILFLLPAAYHRTSVL
jgi:hypothetical protein